MKTGEPQPAEVTPERLYLRRREFVKNGALFVAGSAAFGSGLLWLTGVGKGKPPAPPPVAEEPPVPAAESGGLAIAGARQIQGGRTTDAVR